LIAFDQFTNFQDIFQSEVDGRRKLVCQSLTNLVAIWLDLVHLGVPAVEFHSAERGTIVELSASVSIATMSTQIKIAAAIICDSQGRTLLVRKRNTAFFMQPGGKLDEGETALATLKRELSEELGCSLQRADFLGIFTAPAANEPLHQVHASLFHARITGNIQPGAEIEEIAWVQPSRPGNLPLAPLTRDHVLPLILSLAT
jgi:8-oxo-dGTP diphosphatase